MSDFSQSFRTLAHPLVSRLVGTHRGGGGQGDMTGPK